MNYQQIINNVNSFYTEGSTAVDYLNSLNLTEQELGQIIDATDKFNVTRSANGKIINFTQKADKIIGNTNALNSNIGSSARASVNIPLTSTKLQTGKLLIGQGVTGGMSGLQFLIGSVAPAFAAVGSGIALGKKIDSALYNFNPDFWDAHGMSTLNPETWNSITTNDTTAGRVFNMLWGLNPEDGTAQPYIDQNTLAYVVAYMMQQGFFDSRTVNETTISNFSIQAYKSNTSPAIAHTYEVVNTAGNQGYIYYSDASMVWGITPYTDGLVLVIASTQYGKSFSVIPSSQEPPGSPYYRFQTSSTYDNDGRTVYYGFSNISTDVYPWNFTDWCHVSPSCVPYSEGDINKAFGRFAWDLLYGDSRTVSLDGVTNQTGATQFNTTGIDPTDLASVLAALQAQLPQLFNNAVTQNLPGLDPSPVPGTIYVPIGTPQIDPLHPTQPLGNIATQNDPALDPENYPESALEGAASSMQPPPPDGPNLPDTGTGTIPMADLPTGSAHALFSVYNPSQAEVDSFGAWLWSDDFVEQLKKVFNDPMESIISLHKIFATPVTGSSVNIQVGYLDSEVSALSVTDQYTEVDCGSVTLSEYFRNVYDYVDTEVSLYLPFVGIVSLSVDDVMRASIHVIYKIDVLTGACLVDVNVTRDLSGGVLYQFTGNCAVHYPISSGSYMGIVSGALSIAAGVGSGILTGGASLPISLAVGSAALTRMHANVSRSGSFSANAGAMGAKKPYLIISRPQTALPENYLHFEGVGSNQKVSLASCTGLTKVKDIVLTGFDCTDIELIEIESLLKKGVYL